MKTKTYAHSVLVSGWLMIAVITTHAETLANNFWPNSDFEEGTELSDPAAGKLNGWNRGGSDVTLCQVSAKAFSGNHALSLVDPNNGYGEYYADVSLAGRVVAGDKIDLRWQEVYQIQGGEMRVTLVFQDSSGGATGVKHFVRTGSSAGFGASLDDAPWVQRDESADVPEGTTTLRISLVSGGALSVTGVYVIDELSVARHPAPILLANNLWTNNPTFEDGSDLDQPTGLLTQWNRGGSSIGICQVSSDNSISPSHSLALVDTGNQYGEWYSDLPLAGVATGGDELNLQWFELFNVSAGGEMRVSVLVFNAADAVLDTRHFVATGSSSGWSGEASTSSFAKRNEKLTLPEGAAKLRVSLVSGGSESTTGILLVDDLSINKSAPALPEVLAGNVWPNPGFEEGTDLDTEAGTPVGWSRGGNAPQLCIVTHENSVSPSHALAVSDGSDTGYGEWYNNFRLGASTGGGRLLNLQWFEVYNVTAGEMRLSVQFFNPADAPLGQTHYVARAKSDGWKTSLADSSFTRRNEQVVVPPGATRMQVSLVSGGPAESLGVFAIDTLSIAPAPSAPVVLFGNVWSNPGFEEGVALDTPQTGKPAGWERGGADIAIDQVLTSAFQSSTHALAVVDGTPTSYGEWYRFFDIGDSFQAGAEIEAQWWELFSVSQGGEMRLSVVFFDGAGANIGQKNFVAQGDSAGWGGSVPVSFFTQRREHFTVPAAATKFLVTLTSGGPQETTGVMVIDDLSFAPPLPPPDLLVPNFWVNSTFEEGVQLDNPTAGLPTGWNRGGSYIRGDRVNNQTGTSPTHALELNDDQADGYSEWYQFWTFGDKVRGGDRVDLQWFWVYDTTGDMRLSFLWYDADNNLAGENTFVVRGQSPDFTGDILTSPFAKRSHQIRLPDKAVRGLVSFASGGSLSVQGRIILDDLSLRAIPFRVVDLTRNSEGWSATWSSTADRFYQLQSTESLSPADFQPVPGAESIPGDAAGDITGFTDTRAATQARYYRVVVVPAEGL